MIVRNGPQGNLREKTFASGTKKPEDGFSEIKFPHIIGSDYMSFKVYLKSAIIL